jgi:hypothetical protein
MIARRSKTSNKEAHDAKDSRQSLHDEHHRLMTVAPRRAPQQGSRSLNSKAHEASTARLTKPLHEEQNRKAHEAAPRRAKQKGLTQSLHEEKISRTHEVAQHRAKNSLNDLRKPSTLSKIPQGKLATQQKRCEKECWNTGTVPSGPRANAPAEPERASTQARVSTSPPKEWPTRHITFTEAWTQRNGRVRLPQSPRHEREAVATSHVGT